MRISRSSLRLRLMALALLAALPALGVIHYTNLDHRRREAALASYDQMRSVRIAAATYEQVLDGTHQLLITLSRLPAIRDQENPACGRLLAEILDREPRYVNLGVAAMDGTLTCSARKHSGLVNLSRRSVFQQAAGSRTVVVGNHQTEPVTELPSLPVARAVLDDVGRSTAVVYAAMNLDWLSGLLEQGRPSHQDSLVLVDAGGTVLVRHPKQTGVTGRPFEEPGLAQHILQRGEGAIQARGPDGEKRVHAFAAPARGGFVAVSTPEKTISGNATGAFTLGMVVLAVVGLLALGAAWVGSDFFVLRRIRELLSATRRLQAGDLSARTGADPGRGAELGELSLAFDEMARSLQERDRALREAERRTGEARLASILDITTDAVIKVDGARRVVLFNRGAEQVFGYRADEILHESFDVLLADRSVAVWRRGFEELKATGGATAALDSIDIAGRRSDGTTFPAEATFSKLATGGDTTFTVILRDVTDRRRAEEGLREAEQRFRNAFDTAPIGMAITALDGTYLEVNKALCDILGRTEEELLKMTWQEVTDPESLDEDAELTAKLTTGELPSYVLEKRYVHRSGRTIWALIGVSVIRDAEGQPRYYISQIQDITARKAAQDRLTHQALHDPLTGLPNRALFMDRLEIALSRQRRGSNLTAVLFLDLDRFKVINDSLGHDSGDRLLISCAHRLRKILRPADTVARFGGDEYVILCEDIDHRDEAVRIADRIAEILAAPFQLGEEEVFLTASIGIAMGTGDERPHALLRDADTAMYRAKEQGRARYELFDEVLRGDAVNRLEVERSLRRALEREEFEVFYEPVVDLKTGSIAWFEALVRWRHPEQGLVMPGAFLPVAEETGLIVPIGEWVLDQACAQAVAWSTVRGDGRPVKIAVNLAARQLAQPDLPSRVAEALARNGTDPASISLEITEGVLMSDAESTISALQGLKDLGVELAVDDFGTGYSSLSYLKRFPVDDLKVDRSFVDGLGRDPDDTAIVRVVIGLAHTLGLRAVAEGVETDQQLHELRSLGCDFGQGYYWSRARPATEAEALLLTSPSSETQPMTAAGD